MAVLPARESDPERSGEVDNDNDPVNRREIHVRPANPYLSRNGFQSEGSRKASVPPGRSVDKAPVMLPALPHVRRSRPRSHADRNPALKLSPAPIVSTGSTGTAS